MDTEAFITTTDGLLNVNGVFENRFDVILTNPPFGSRVEKSLEITETDVETDVQKIAAYEKKYGKEVYQQARSQINDHIGDSVLDLYTVGKLSGLTEVLFIERCIRLLKPGGRLGIVLPEEFSITLICKLYANFSRKWPK